MRFIEFGASVMKTWNTVSGFVRKAWARVKAAVKGTSAEVDVNRIDEETRKANQRETDIAQGAKEIIRDDTSQKQAEIDKQRHDLDSELFDKARSINDERQKAFEAALASDEDELAKMKGQWQSLIDEANAKDPVSAADGGKAGGKLSEMAEQIETGMKAFDTEARSVNKALELGTAEAQKAILDAMTGRTDPQIDIAKNTAATTEAVKHLDKKLRDIERAIENGGLILQRT